MKILVTGSRHWPEDKVDLIEEALVKILLGNNPPNRPPWSLIVGDNKKGVDKYASDMWLEWGHEVMMYVANWHSDCQRTCKPGHRKTKDGRSYCPAAGPYRNQRMVDDKPDICLAFPLGDSPGTYDCIRRARAAGIPVVITHPDGTTEVK